MIASRLAESKTAWKVFFGTLVALVLILVVSGRNPLTFILVMVNGVSFYWACWAYIKAKGRSGFWLLAPVLFVYLGVLILWFLDDKSEPDVAEDGIPSWARVKQ